MPVIGGGTRGPVDVSDIGDKRIGVAVSDLWASQPGIETWTRRSIREDAEHFKALATSWTWKSWSRARGTWTVLSGSRAKKCGTMPEDRRDAGPGRFDERLTTAAAGQVLLMADVSRGKRRGVVDKWPLC